MKKSIILSALALSVALTSCSDLFEPAIENNLGLEYMYNNSKYAEGILGNAYTRIPVGSPSFNEVATDDAVTNEASNSWHKMAGGTWTSSNNPMDAWTGCRAAILYLNLFLANADKVNWAEDQTVSKMYNDREKGEAYGMRAMFMYYLLRAHGGYGEDGVLYGVPIVTEPEDANTNSNIPRATFADCIKAINDDCDKALELLPTNYKDVEDESQIPAKYKGATTVQYNRVFGSKFNLRMCGRYVEAYRAKASLLAASPAFADGSGVTYETAANNFATVLDRIGGPAGLDPTGNTWYCNTKDIDGIENGECKPEIMWREERGQRNTLEQDNFPPSLYGNGRINPTQNFVDAFPMANGEPITAEGSGYNKDNPYVDRDPRLALYVVTNGSTQGVANTTITTAADGTTQDAINKLEGKSTRTGYYLRKLMRSDINLDPSMTTTQYHYNARIRFTEMFLSYAEAANEAWGPKGKGGHGYSAYDVIKAIRERAGLGEFGEDPYLEECAESKDKMRELIRNERRIELSFEGFRFYDLRRWKAPLNETAKGMSINSADNTYTPIEVETRNYKDYMYYGPIPYSEVLKFSELQQNKGW